MKKATWVSIGAGFIRACVIIYTIPQIVASLKDIKGEIRERPTLLHKL